MTIIYILSAILLFGILVTVHEWGHFIAARLTGIPVTEFAIGFGPKLLGWKSKKFDTKFSIRAIPMGGFCAFVGEDDATGKHQDDPGAFSRQKLWKRFITVLMGPMMNFVLAFVVLVVYFSIAGMPVVTGADPYIASVESAGPAAAAGLQADDVVTEVNGVSVLDGTTDTFIQAIGSYQAGDAPLNLTVQRGDEVLHLFVEPFLDEGANRYRIGITVGGMYRTEMERVNPIQAIGESWDRCIRAGGLIINALKNLITKGEGLDQTAGPVGLVSTVTQEVRKGGFQAFMNLLVAISINLGIMNLLPIPGLDGSRLLFLLVEGIRRKPIPPQKEAVIHLCGYVVLFGLMLFFTYRDILRLFQ